MCVRVNDGRCRFIGIRQIPITFSCNFFHSQCSLGKGPVSHIVLDVQESMAVNGDRTRGGGPVCCWW